MERQSERLGDYPEVQAKVEQHLTETNQQLQRLEICLEECGETSSTLKDTPQSVMANTMAMAHAMAGDEVLKNTFANNALNILRSRPTSHFLLCALLQGKTMRARCWRRICRRKKGWLPGSTPMSRR